MKILLSIEESSTRLINLPRRNLSVFPPSLLISGLHHLDIKDIGARFALQILDDGLPPFQ